MRERLRERDVEREGDRRERKIERNRGIVKLQRTKREREFIDNIVTTDQLLLHCFSRDIVTPIPQCYSSALSQTYSCCNTIVIIYVNTYKEGHAIVQVVFQ